MLWCFCILWYRTVWHSCISQILELIKKSRKFLELCRRSINTWRHIPAYLYIVLGMITHKSHSLSISLALSVSGNCFSDLCPSGLRHSFFHSENKPKIKSFIEWFLLPRSGSHLVSTVTKRESAFVAHGAQCLAATSNSDKSCTNNSYGNPEKLCSNKSVKCNFGKFLFGKYELQGVPKGIHSYALVQASAVPRCRCPRDWRVTCRALHAFQLCKRFSIYRVHCNRLPLARFYNYFFGLL